MNDFQRDCCLNCCAKWDFEQQVMSAQVGDVELNSIFSLLNIQRFLAGSRIHVVLAMNTRWRLNINFVQHQHHKDTTRERERAGRVAQWDWNCDSKWKKKLFNDPLNRLERGRVTRIETISDIFFNLSHSLPGNGSTTSPRPKEKRAKSQEQKKE